MMLQEKGFRYIFIIYRLNTQRWLSCTFAHRHLFRETTPWNRSM